MKSVDSPSLVSIVIPTIKFDRYTEISIRSILEQTYDNWEIILVLDGAPVSTVPDWVIDDYRIELVIHEFRQGTPKSLNDGVKASHGELVARLDADDIAHPERLAIQVRYMETNPSVVCVGTSTCIIDENGKFVSEFPAPKYEGDIRDLLLINNQLVHSSVMYRKKNFEAINGYSLIMKRAQDYELYLRLARTGQIDFIDATLCAYRVHLGQHSRKTSPFSNYTLEILKQRNHLAKFLSRNRFAQLLRNIIWYFAQIVRYSGLRKPRYIDSGSDVNENKKDSKWLEAFL
ncbi:glycosyltransferase family A protein [Corynebacterium callunae]|uniref:glycosyltransferase family A protein n=1 Tax=Corynebacterium callunae TaxID=1721 RepID=UPI003982AEB7